MQKFDSVEHAKELNSALEDALLGIPGQDSAVDDTVRFDTHNVSEKTKGINSIDNQKPHA